MKPNLPSGVRLEVGQGGLERLTIQTAAASAHVYLLGAHVTHYQPVGQDDVLWMSRQSQFSVGKPIRGGVPICFPWFAVHASDPSKPSHGVVRQALWTLESCQASRDQVVATLVKSDDEHSRALWPCRFRLAHLVTVGPTLKMELLTTNTDAREFRFEQALHTYFGISDIRQTTVTGLENARYLSKTQGNAMRVQGDEPIRFTAQTDRLYNATDSACVIHDPGRHRRIVVEKSGSRSTVVWNPWTDKAKAMPDFGDDEWPGMLCVETANAGPDAITLAPGATHNMTATIRVEK